MCVCIHMCMCIYTYKMHSYKSIFLLRTRGTYCIIKFQKIDNLFFMGTILCGMCYIKKSAACYEFNYMVTMVRGIHQYESIWSLMIGKEQYFFKFLPLKCLANSIYKLVCAMIPGPCYLGTRDFCS